MNALIWRRLLYLLILSLVFEGILRKLAPTLLSQALFFAKDGICLLMVFLLIRDGLTRAVMDIVGPWLLLVVFMIPVLLNTLMLDPLLVVFGGKQYLLFPIYRVRLIKAAI